MTSQNGRSVTVETYGFRPLQQSDSGIGNWIDDQSGAVISDEAGSGLQ